MWIEDKVTNKQTNQHPQRGTIKSTRPSRDGVSFSIPNAHQMIIWYYYNIIIAYYAYFVSEIFVYMSHSFYFFENYPDLASTGNHRPEPVITWHWQVLPALNFHPRWLFKVWYRDQNAQFLQTHCLKFSSTRKPIGVSNKYIFHFLNGKNINLCSRTEYLDHHLHE